MPDPIVDTAVGGQDPTPMATKGFGARESADETRQAQQSFSNDTPTDINFNAVVARDQQLTLSVLGKNYESNADRRGKIADAYMAKLMAGAT